VGIRFSSDLRRGQTLEGAEESTVLTKDCGAKLKGRFIDPVNSPSAPKEL
jgi:hypothetical protein